MWRRFQGAEEPILFSEHIQQLDVDSAAHAYAAASPFPHAVLDDVIDPDLFEAAVRDFPGRDAEAWTNYLHVNERKRGNVRYDSWPESIRAVADTLTSAEFIDLLQRLTGIEGLLPDPAFDGGGLHRSERGGFLNIHADFSKHHVNQDWQRRVNALLYMNAEWEDDWGGHLELWSTDMSHCVEKVAPKPNRMVIFTTTSDSFHGHPTPMTCPAGVARQSMALYYFTPGSDLKPRSTDYRARPGDGIKRVAIAADRGVVKMYDKLKRATKMSDDRASGLLSRLGGGKGKEAGDE